MMMMYEEKTKELDLRNGSLFFLFEGSVYSEEI